jgi:hypothetical protein
MQNEPMDGHEHGTPELPVPLCPEHVTWSHHEAVTLLRTYMGTEGKVRRPADRSALAASEPAAEKTPASNGSVARTVLKLAILMETAGVLAFFVWVLSGG